MILFMNGVGILAAKKLIKILWFVMPAQVVLLWNVEI